ncbi:MAG: MoxR family ATPase [Treponema sp.]|jgi:MoxR-like ATPase|nr:MoxR family ATPase [Treponema sp.]
MDQHIAPETAAELFSACRKELAKRIAGQREMIDGLLAALTAGGHILLEGVPGLAKTLAVKSLAEITGLVFKRIQFTPDLLPADLTGTLIWEQGRGDFSVRRGPLFANVILADEINRAPAKVQSALLEAMEEKQITIGETSCLLPDPFFVLATQNPIEQEGTYALPEAELDRFFIKLLISYPSPEEEIDILGRYAGMSVPAGTALSAVLNPGKLLRLREAADAVHTDGKIAEYIVSLTASTRPLSSRTDAGRYPANGKPSGAVPVRLPKEGLYRYISYGASPRASIALYRLSRIFALMEGRSFVTPEDVKAAAFPVLRHRIVLSYEAEADGLDTDAVISRILSLVPIP